MYKQPNKVIDLVNKYPKIFKFIPECACHYEAGWDNLIEDLCSKLSDYCTENEIAVTQIKEKFGGLRFYFRYLNSPLNEKTKPRWDKIFEIINTAYKKSILTCEVCGKKGFTRKGGRVQTLCDNHGEGRERLQL